MSPTVRLVVSLFVRLLLLFFAGWFAIADSALPSDASVVSRVGLSLLFLIASLLVGEVSTVRLHVGMLLGALRKVSGGAGAVSDAVAKQIGTQAVPPTAGSVRESVDILIKALGANDADTRQKAHAHLRRLTGQDLPPDAERWRAWWSKARDTFEPPGTETAD